MEIKKTVSWNEACHLLTLTVQAGTFFRLSKKFCRYETSDAVVSIPVKSLVDFQNSLDIVKNSDFNNVL
jgi:hypothetical protein